ncbi:hypothetical protein SAMN02746066_03708 [Anaerosporobacter mobilis DSM 15930]|jgi:hypothetical protein|uniref:Uncharacterized protein n=1 Tax=Anaerosporobacter mobilis DSM 15930 TaxID=1120996 RepID=A0A1M7MAS4_9FIRM|nr:hypothetical protein [Anaerosporobacter mobilis]SHM87829.1 hypothetical protein SAMN02746066_03708 [Anaerosporobacter mobilis DSM 15930]
MIKYRISKYNPNKRDSNNKYAVDTWTSYADIGKNYNNNRISFEEYIEVENNYVIVLMMVLEAVGVKRIQINDLEINFTISEMNQMFTNKLPMLTEVQINIINTLKNNYSIDYPQIGEYVRLILRECFWCRLYDKETENNIEFGYDYYMYITCAKIPNDIINRGSNIGVYIEKI